MVQLAVHLVVRLVIQSAALSVFRGRGKIYEISREILYETLYETCHTTFHETLCGVVSTCLIDKGNMMDEFMHHE